MVELEASGLAYRVKIDNIQELIDQEIARMERPPRGDWFYHEFHVADVVDLTAQVRVRFVASDEDAGSIVEAAVDDFLVLEYYCEETECPGDLNDDGQRDQADLGILLADWGCSGGNCPGDVDGDGDTDQADLGFFLSVFGEPCP